MRTSLLKLLPLLAVALLAGCDIEDMVAGTARYKEDFHFTERLSPGGRLTVENFNGSIEVAGWDKDEVDITGTKYASSENLLKALDIDVVGTGDLVQVRTVKPSGHRGHMGARYLIRVPRKVSLDRLESSNGSIKVSDIEGLVRLRTSNGRIQVASLRGDVDAASSNGSITLRDTSGAAELRTSNGSVTAESVRGRFTAKTSNGSIDVTLAEQPSAEVVATTSNSSITLRAPSNLAAEIRASTSNATIKTDFTVQGKAFPKKKRLEGTINGGGPLIRLNSSNGSIRILKLNT